MFRTILLALSLSLAAPACASANGDGIVATTLTDQEARGQAARMLDALARGDYAAYSYSFSDAMRRGVTEDAFRKFRSELLAGAGNYVAIESFRIEDAKTPGFVKWVFVVRFERATLDFALVYAERGNLVEGVHFTKHGS